jgi:hypothetical protein
VRHVLAAVLLALLAAFGVSATPQPAQLSVATGVIEETQPAAPSVAATLELADSTTARRRTVRRLRGVVARRARTARSWTVRSWRLPATVVGGVPPGRAPPLVAARL